MQQNKFSGIVLLFTLLLGFLVLPARADVGPDLRVIDSRFSGSLAPGLSSQLTVQLANVGVFACAYKVTTSIQVSTPLSVSGSSSTPVEKFCAPNNYSASFNIQVDPNAPIGAYPISVTTTYESEYRAAYSVTNTVYAYVTGTPRLEAHVSQSNPVVVYPDDEFLLGITLENTGAYRADSLSLELADAGGLEIRPSTQIQSLPTLAPRSSALLWYSLHVPKQLSSQSYPLDFKAHYLDENGMRKTLPIFLKFTVSPKARLDAFDGKSQAFIDTRNNLLTFTLQNNGNDAARRIRAKLLPAYPFSTQGSVQFIDRLEPGTQAPLRFFVNVDNEGVPGTYAMDVSLSYENDAGDSFTETLPVSTRVETLPLVNAVFYNYWYFWLVVVLVGIVMLRRRMSPKKGK